MGSAVLIGQQRLGEKRSNIQLSTPIDLMPFYPSLFSSFTSRFLPVSLLIPISLVGRISEVGGGEQINKQVCVCVCLCYLIVILSLNESQGVFGCLGFGFTLSVCLHISLVIQIPIVCLFQHLQMWFVMLMQNCINSSPMHQAMTWV